MVKKLIKNKKDIISIFPFLNEEEFYEDRLIGKYGYNKLVISVFDHWLSEEEADKKIASFSTLEMSGSDRKSFFFEKENDILNFYKLIFNNNLLVGINTENFSVYDFLSESDFLNKCKESIREIEFLTLALPEKKVILVGTYDLNIVLYFLDKELIKNILNSIHKSNLFLLK